MSGAWLRRLWATFAACLAIGVLGVAPCAAAPASAAGLLAEVAGRLVQAPAIQGKFEQTRRIAGFPQPLVSRGDFVLLRDKGVAWHTRQPIPSSLVLSAGGLEIRGADGHVQQSMQADAQPGLRAILDTVLAVLRADPVTLSQRFRVAGSLQGEHGWLLRLTPSDPVLARLYAAIELEGDRYVRKVSLREVSGDSTEIRLKDTTVAQASAAAPALRHE